jgi:hypothetical protein
MSAGNQNISVNFKVTGVSYHSTLIAFKRKVILHNLPLGALAQLNSSRNS